MDIRYLGFDQADNARAYRFDLITRGADPQHLIVTADLRLFRSNSIGLQEGPTLCARKLMADLESRQEGAHELTDRDMAAHNHELAAVARHKEEMRLLGARRRKPAEESNPAPDFYRGR